MENNFDMQKFKRYFHHGLEYDKNDILDVIIMSSSKDKDLQTTNREMNQLEYKVDIIENMYLQFKRFVELTANNKQPWYQRVTQKDVSDDVMQRINELEKSRLISVVTYKPMWGIYINDRVTTRGDGETNYTGEKRYQEIPDWIKNDIIPILKYLRQLENKNPYQYCSLFMDTKYARSINCNQRKGADKIQVLYTKFMEMVKPAKEDMCKLFPEKITNQEAKLIEQNSADYWTITDLKQSAKTDKYQKKVQNCYQNIKNLEYDERSK